MTAKPWIETPCVYSAALSKVAGCNIFLKLEFLQPSGSFKSRGVGNFMYESVARTAKSDKDARVHFYCSSSGNAGLACATAARRLGLPATIVVPMTTSAYMIGKLRAAGADVQQKGADWPEADGYLRDVVMPSAAASCTPVYVPPFNHPDIWQGASTMVGEIVRDLGDEARPDAIVCSVGGGGLFCGVMQGLVASLPRPGTVTVVTVETRGADSLASSMAAGQHVTLPAITSIASSLGARRVADQTFAWSQRRSEQQKQQPAADPSTLAPAVSPLVISDAEAVAAIGRFLDDHRILVEPACSASLAAVYGSGGKTLRELVQGDSAAPSDEEWAKKNVVVIVCGGCNINLELLRGYQEKFGL